MDSPVNHTARFFIYVGRLLITLAILALFGAWATQWRSGPFFGMDQQHFFNDAIALSLIGGGFLLDGLLHSKGL